MATVALLAEGVDRNLRLIILYAFLRRSPSSRRAWIEITRRFTMRLKGERSPSSRRAWIEMSRSKSSSRMIASPSSRRAWIEIACRQERKGRKRWSPSSRRAWIEIRPCERHHRRSRVALLAEGVDRNRVKLLALSCGMMSPSSRRAWIEIGRTERRLENGRRRPPRGGRG